MAEPNDSAFVLFDITEFFRTQYRAGVPDQFMFHDSRTRRFFRPEYAKLGAKDYEVTLGHQPVRSARITDDLLAATHDPGSYGMDIYTISIDETAASNDLRRCMASMRITEVDRTRASQTSEAKANLVDRLQRQTIDGVNLHLAIHTHIDSNATLGTVDGTPKDDDANLYADCSSYGAGATTARIIVDGPIAYFTPGMKVDFYTSGGSQRIVNNGVVKIVTIEDVKVEDNSISVKVSGSSPGNLDTLADTDTIHMSGEFGKHWTSLGEWFADGDIFGKDRTATSARYLVPTLLRSGSSAATFEPSFLDDAAKKMFSVWGEKLNSKPWRAHMSPEIYQDYIDNIDAATLQTKTLSDNPKARYGYTGASYRHPLLGEIGLEPDQLATRGKVRFTTIGDWFTLWAANRTFTWIPGEQGMWYRIGDGAGGGKTMFWQSDGYLMGVDACTFPRGQFEIQNLTN